MSQLLRARISRESADDRITLEQWLAFVSQSATVRLMPPRMGVHPVTGKPQAYEPAAGTACFDGARGLCTISYHSGVLIFSDATEDEMPVLNQIAAGMGATLKAEKRASR